MKKLCFFSSLWPQLKPLLAVEQHKEEKERNEKKNRKKKRRIITFYALLVELYQNVSGDEVQSRRQYGSVVDRDDDFN